MLDTCVKNLCFECRSCYTLTFIREPDVIYINDIKNKKYYCWDIKNTGILDEYDCRGGGYKEKKLIEEDIELLFSVGIKEFYKLFQQNKLKGIYK
jgi:hypothetical protein